MDAGQAADALIERVRARPWGLAVIVHDEDSTEIRIDPGVDEMTEDSTFQIGSVTKTFTGVLVADCVIRGELSLEATVGDIMAADAGGAAAVTVEQLATQRSGLPRLPPNLDSATIDRSDPYAAYSAADLVAGLAATQPSQPGTYEYSNFGFMLLGHLLTTATGTPYADLVTDRIFAPLKLTSAGCPPPDADRLRGYTGTESTPWWTTQLPGAGGIGMNIADLGRYLRAHFDGSGHDILDQAMALATTLRVGPPSGMGLGWGHQGGGWWHNGATGGFRSFVALHQPTRTAVGLLANSSDAEVLDAAGFRILTQMLSDR